MYVHIFDCKVCEYVLGQLAVCVSAKALPTAPAQLRCRAMSATWFCPPSAAVLRTSPNVRVVWESDVESEAESEKSGMYSSSEDEASAETDNRSLKRAAATHSERPRKWRVGVLGRRAVAEEEEKDE